MQTLPPTGEAGGGGAAPAWSGSAASQPARHYVSCAQVMGWCSPADPVPHADVARHELYSTHVGSAAAAATSAQASRRASPQRGGGGSVPPHASAASPSTAAAAPVSAAAAATASGGRAASHPSTRLLAKQASHRHRTLSHELHKQLLCGAPAASATSPPQSTRAMPPPPPPPQPHTQTLPPATATGLRRLTSRPLTHAGGGGGDGGSSSRLPPCVLRYRGDGGDGREGGEQEDSLGLSGAAGGGKLVAIGEQRTTRALRVRLKHPRVGLGARVRQMVRREVLAAADAPDTRAHGEAQQRHRHRRCRRASATTRTLVHNGYDGWRNPYSGTDELPFLGRVLPDTLRGMAALSDEALAAQMPELQELRRAHDMSSAAPHAHAHAHHAPHNALLASSAAMLISDDLPSNHTLPARRGGGGGRDTRPRRRRQKKDAAASSPRALVAYAPFCRTEQRGQIQAMLPLLRAEAPAGAQRLQRRSTAASMWSTATATGAGRAASVPPPAPEAEQADAAAAAAAAAHGSLVRDMEEMLAAASPQGAVVSSDHPPFEGKDGLPLTAALVRALQKQQVLMGGGGGGGGGGLAAAAGTATHAFGATGGGSSGLTARSARALRRASVGGAMLAQLPSADNASQQQQQHEAHAEDALRVTQTRGGAGAGGGGGACGLSYAELRQLHLRVLVLNRHRARKGRDLLPKLRELTAPLKAPSGTGGAIPTPSDLLVVRILFDAMADANGITPEILRQYGWGFGGRHVTRQTFRVIDRSRTGVLRFPDLVKFLYPHLDMKDVRLLVARLEATTDRSASIQMISGPAWLALYPSCAIEEAFELFVRLGGDENTGLLEVSKLVSHYLVGAGVPVGEADLQEMVGAEEVVSLEHFVALFATHTFEAEDQLGPSPSEEGGGGGGGGDDDALDGS